MLMTWPELRTWAAAHDLEVVQLRADCAVVHTAGLDDVLASVLVEIYDHVIADAVLRGAVIGAIKAMKGIP